MFDCYVCLKSFLTANQLVCHLKITHRNTSAFTYRCAQPKCSRTFQTIHKFKNHLKFKHAHSNSNNSNSSSYNRDTQYRINNDADSNEEDNEVEFVVTDPDSVLVDSTLSTFRDLVKSASSAFCAKLYTVKNLPRSHIQLIIEEVGEYLSTGFLSILKSKVIRLLQNCEQILPENVHEISDMFDVLESPFIGLSSEYLRLKMLKENKFYLPPISYVIGTMLNDTTNSDGVKVLQNTEVFGQFLPLSFTLKGVFQLTGVYELIKENIVKICQSSVASSILQGEVWKKKLSAFAIDKQPDVFPLLLYFDDFECGNPLGSHSGVHKTGVVYYSVPAVPIQLQAKLENIFVALIFNSNDRVQFGNRSTFEPLINELKLLETEGITIKTNSLSKTIYFVVLAITGDNLGANSILGYVESFSSNHYCRICRCHKSIMSKQLSECNENLRTLENYHCDLMQKNVTETGISSESVWCQIPTFNNIDNVVCDIMHDVFEGVCRYDMALIINDLIKNKLFSLTTLNFRIKHFEYGKHVSNLPPQINSDHLKRKCIIMSASEMLNLVKNFCFLIGDLVPKEYEVWLFFLSLRDIVDCVLSDSFHPDLCSFVQGAVIEHHRMYLNLFNETLKPKHHFLVHYPRMMRKFGPPKQLWCMRFEAKNAQLKGTATSISSRRNLPLSLATKCQLQLAYRFMSGIGLRDEFLFGPGDLISSSALVGCGQYHLDENVVHVSWASINGIHYSVNCVIYLGVTDDDNPKFSKIEHVLCDEGNNCMFVLSIYSTFGYDLHIHAFEVGFPIVKSYILLEFKKLNDVKVYSAITTCKGKTYVSYP